MLETVDPSSPSQDYPYNGLRYKIGRSLAIHVFRQMHLVEL